MLSTGRVYSLRAMSYNIRYETASDGKNQWSFRKDHLANLIRNRAPDIFGLQEALRDQIADLKTALPIYHHYGVGDRNCRGRDEFAPIFYRSDRFDLH